MNQKTLNTLELPKILERMARYTAFSAGHDAALALEPSTDLGEVRRRQQFTSEAVRLLSLRPELGLGGVHDLRSSVRRAMLGSILAAEEFMAILVTLEASREVRGVILRTDERNGLPALAELARNIAMLSQLETVIRSTFDKDGNVADSASPELGRIRGQVRVAHDRIIARLNQILSSTAGQNSLQEPIISMRDGRYVVPVKSDFRGQMRGIIHDQSSSGATLWVEPLAVVELANDWRKLQLDEQEEVVRILRELGRQVGAEAEPITTTVETLADIDVIFACARYSMSLDAVEPGLGRPNASTAHAGDDRQDGPRPIAGGDKPIDGILLRNARHPLLTGRVVPINVELGDRFRILMITGPNTGGKTVALKTIGLLTLMAMCGMHVPADSGTRLLVVDKIFADIGDEQSIEQSLSTFSSHMTNIIDILKQIDDRTLLLLDELGAGTDPQEGSALARSLINNILHSGALCIATTHYSELKAYAYATPGVENASVEFNVQTLAPTYKLTVGLPGRSNALAIATRLGLNRELIEEAKRYLNPEDEHVEDLLAGIQREREQASNERQQAERSRQQAELRQRDLERQLRDVERQRQEALVEARAQAEEELAELRNLIRQVRTESTSSDLTREWVQQQAQRIEEAQRDLRNRNRQRNNQAAAERRGQQAPNEPRRPLAPGDRVHVAAFDSVGDVLTNPDSSGNVEVQLGAFKLRLKAVDLQRIGKDEPGWQMVETPEPKNEGPRAWGTPLDTPRRQAGQSASSLLRTASAAQVPLEIDLRGYRAEEIEPALEPYLEDAAMAAMPMVRIIHGKGTGVLRQVVRDMLRRHPLVTSWIPGPIEQGGEGVTVAYFGDKKN